MAFSPARMILAGLGAIALGIIEGVTGAISGKLIDEFRDWTTGPEPIKPEPPKPNGPDPVVARSNHAVSLVAEGGGPSARRLADDLQEAVIIRLMPSSAEQLQVGYRLDNLTLEGGARKSVNLAIALAHPNKSPVRCGAVRVTYHSSAALAERIARDVNRAIVATDREGEPKCG